MDALELPYGLTPDSVRSSSQRCPGCEGLGTFVLSPVMITAQIGEFSLAGNQLKTSASVGIRATCDQCGWGGVGVVEENYLVIRDLEAPAAE